MAEPLLETGAWVLDGYQVVRPLHRGADTDVYDAWSWSRDCACIVKVLRADRVEDERAVARTRSEAQLLASLTHPNIVRLYEHALDGARPAMVLERIDAVSLLTMVHEMQRLIPWPEVVMWAAQLCAAMSYVHRQGALHLDLKPDNVLVARDRITVIDFHVTQAPGPCRKRVGTRRYMSPEQARGDDVSEASDVWGVGCVLYEAAGGQPVFRQDDFPEDDQYPQLSESPRPIRELRTLPSSVATCIDACLERTPANRPTLAQVVAHLHA